MSGWRSSGSGGSSPARPTSARFWANVEAGVAATARGPARPLARSTRSTPSTRASAGPTTSIRPGAASSRGSGSTPRGSTSTRRCSTGSTRCSTWPSTPAGPPGATRGPRGWTGRGSASSSATSSCRPSPPRPSPGTTLGRTFEEALGIEPGPVEPFEPLNARVAGPAGRAAGEGARAGRRGVHARRGVRLVALRPEAGGRRADRGPGRRDADRRALAARPALHPDGLLAAPGPLAHRHGLARSARRPTAWSWARGPGMFVLKRLGDAIRQGDRDLRRDRRHRPVERRRRRPARPQLRGAAPRHAGGLRSGRLGARATST